MISQTNLVQTPISHIIWISGIQVVILKSFLIINPLILISSYTYNSFLQARRKLQFMRWCYYAGHIKLRAIKRVVLLSMYVRLHVLFTFTFIYLCNKNESQLVRQKQRAIEQRHRPKINGRGKWDLRRRFNEPQNIIKPDVGAHENSRLFHCLISPRFYNT